MIQLEAIKDVKASSFFETCALTKGAFYWGVISVDHGARFIHHDGVKWNLFNLDLFKPVETYEKT